jgi:molecular chaperone GrpE
MSEPETTPEATSSSAKPADQKSTPVENTANAEDPFAEFGTKLTEAQAAADDFRDRWLRSQAELENYRKRSQKELDAERQYRSMAVVRDILPALDGLQRALQVAKTTKDVDQLLKGMQMVVQQFEDALARHSVVAINAVGQPFDPNQHEAIQQAPSKDHPPMTVLHEVERGYQLFDRVVRPTKVIVSVTPPE